MARKPSGLMVASSQPMQAPVDVPQPVGTQPSQKAGRVGKKMVAAWMDRAAAKQLQGIAFEEDTTIQDLVCEAVNMLFRSRGKPELARIERKDAA